MYIFISHSSKEAHIAKELCTILEANGNQCFLAPRNIRTGYEYAAEIVDGIDRSDAVLLLLSNNAMSSPHILREVERAVSKSIPIIVYKLEDVVLTKSYEYFLMSHQWLDAELCRYDRLLECINDLEGNTNPTNLASSVPPLIKTAPTPTTVYNNTGNSNAKKHWLMALGVLAAAVISTVLIILTCCGVFTGDTSSDNQNNIVNNNSDAGQTGSYTDAPTVSSGSNDTVLSDIKLGDTIILGKYNDVEISWKVLSISEDKTEATLVSRDILTFKGFDGADSGTYTFDNSAKDLQSKVNSSGNNSWADSSIRAWLNSYSDYVQYNGARPTALSMTDQCNGYDLEPGFLYNFDATELSAIKDTTLITKGNQLSGLDTITTTDKVFLLSSEDLALFEAAGVSTLAVPTAKAVEKNESSFYKEYCQGVFRVNSCNWWLRDPVESSVTDCYQVGHGAKTENNNVYTSVVCADGYGIRPAITVDLTSKAIKKAK